MSLSHRFHPAARDPQTAAPILYDDCERCREHTIQPWTSLDAPHLLRLREINLGVVTPLTRMERLAANSLREYDARVLLETDAHNVYAETAGRMLRAIEVQELARFYDGEGPTDV